MRITKAERIIGGGASGATEAHDVYLEDQIGPVVRRFAVRVYEGNVYLYNDIDDEPLDQQIPGQEIVEDEA
jgi:hypothetical protein